MAPPPRHMLRRPPQLLPRPVCPDLTARFGLLVLEQPIHPVKENSSEDEEEEVKDKKAKKVKKVRWVAFRFIIPTLVCSSSPSSPPRLLIVLLIALAGEEVKEVVQGALIG